MSVLGVNMSLSEKQILDMKLILVFALVIFLYISTSVRNDKRYLLANEVTFKNIEQPLITEEVVNKLLIQNKGSVKNIKKVALALNSIESVLDANPYVRNSEVYVSVNGIVGVDVLQKKPLARVQTKESYYIDEEGKKMPTSPNFAVRVPLVSGDGVESNLNNMFKLLKSIDSDSFYKKEIVEIIVSKKGKYKLLLREFDLFIDFGTTENIELKLNNFKAFYKKATKDKTINKYKYVNLQIASQVICTKI
jgi:cell division protein FtsQ